MLWQARHCIALSLPGPSLRTTFASCAAARPLAAAAATKRMRLRMALSLDDFDIDALDHVVVITRGIVDELLDLVFSGAARRARHDDVGAALAHRQVERELAERELAEILAEPRALPGRARIARHFHP